MTTTGNIRLRIVCLQPPPAEKHGAVFGLQDNSTTTEWIVHAGETLKNGDLRFECECKVAPHAHTGAPNFLGPFVQGDSAKRFLYLSWRPANWRRGDPEPSAPNGVRRMKIHLGMITWAQIDDAIASNGCLEVKVEGIGADGRLNCASVPLIGGGWRVSRP